MKISSKSKYNQYLQSPQWQEIRSRAIKRDNYRCTVCGSKNRLEVHHLTYDRKYHENLSDLTTLCQKHHRRIHGIIPIHERIIAVIDGMLMPMLYALLVVSIIMYKINTKG